MSRTVILSQLLAFCAAALWVSPGCRPSRVDSPERAEERREQENDGDSESLQPPRVTVTTPPSPHGEEETLHEEGSRRGASEDSTVAAADDPSGGPESWTEWPAPQVVLVVSGQQDGYIEPCGCTGLDNQKGGLARRFTLIEQLRDREWEVVPVDAGNQVRRFGRQPEIKFNETAKGLAQMGYRAIGLGPADLRLGVGELLAVAAGEEDRPTSFVSANVTLLAPDLIPTFQIVEAGGRRIGITAALDPAKMEVTPGDEIVVDEVIPAVQGAAEQLAQHDCDYRVLLFLGDAVAAEQLARDVPQFDLIVSAGDPGEPTYNARELEGTPTRLVLTGNKGMYVGLVGLYDDAPPRYARVGLTHDLPDAPEMLQLLASYQQQLQQLGLEGLNLRPVSHPSGKEFIGSAACGECHTTAHDIWEGTPHAHATESLVYPPERGEVPRHFDPECLSCHVTGWNPQGFFPYLSGYLSLESSEHLTGSGCENCHGPGAEHVAAERGESDVDEGQQLALRYAMRLPLSRAKEKCIECHDIDNSPDFHREGAFEEFWAQIEHYGLD